MIVLFRALLEQRHYAPARLQLHAEWELREPIANMAQKVLHSEGNSGRQQPRVTGMGLSRRMATGRACLAQVWTSEKQLQGREFCFIFNELIRNDELLEDDVANKANMRTRPVVECLSECVRSGG